MYNKILARTFFLIIALLSITANAQTPTFNVYIEPMNVPGLGGLQAYAFGQDNGKWLIIGGRLDGLHRRQPFAAFDVAGNNNQLIVIASNSTEMDSTNLCFTCFIARAIKFYKY